MKPTFNGIQTELLLLVFRQVNLNGDLPSLRLTCSRFNDIIIYEAPAFLTELQTTYSLAPVLVKPASLPTLIRLQAQLHHLQNSAFPTISHHHLLASLLLTSHLHHQLTTPANHSNVTLTTPLPTLTATITTPLPKPYLNAIRTLSLADLDTYIDGLNECATALWRAIETCRIPAPTTRQDASSSSTASSTTTTTHDHSSSSDTDLARAICAEIAIWRGVPWCLRFLQDARAGRLHGAGADAGDWGSMSGLLTARCLLLVEDKGGTTTHQQAVAAVGLGRVWRGTVSEAGKLASGGLAGWLWRERKARYEEAVERSGDGDGGRALVGVRPCLGVGVLL